MKPKMDTEIYDEVRASDCTDLERILVRYRDVLEPAELAAIRHATNVMRRGLRATGYPQAFGPT